MATPLALVWDLIARDNASATFNRVGTAAQVNAARIGSMGAAAEASSTRLGKASKAMESVVGIGAKLGLTIGAAAFAFEAFKEGSQFQRQMLQIQTLTGGTAAEVRDMSKAVLDLAGSVGSAPDKLALSLYHVESVGLRGAAAMHVVEIAAKGAKIGMADLEETTNALTSTVASGIPGVENMSQAMGALLTIVGAGDMKVSDLNEALGGGILSVVKGYGLTLNDVGAALATFGDNNIRGADAATALRMAVQALAVPAKTGKDAIESIGLSMNTLQKDMQHGGLNSALLDLNAHMRQAGITGVQVGGFLTEAFGKRAGVGLSVLMGQLDRFESKVAAIKDGAGGFASKWDETTHTVGFAFDRLKTEIQTAGVHAFETFGPAIGGFVNMLATDIPAAIRKMTDTLGPAISLVRTGFVAAWHAAAGTLRIAESALSGISDVMSHHKALVTGVGVAVVGMWAAYKGYQIARTAIRAVSSAMETMALKAMYASEATAAVSARSALMGTALGVVGVAIGAATLAWANHAAQVAQTKQDIADLTQAYKDDSGAIAGNTDEVIANQLQKAGAAKAANDLGISLRDVTLAAEGNAAATARIGDAYATYRSTLQDTIRVHESALSSDRQQIDAGSAITGTLTRQGNAWDALNKIIGTGNTDLQTAIQKYRDHNALLGKGEQNARAQSTAIVALTQHQKDLTTAMGEEQINIDGVTYAMDKQKTAADVLSAAIAALSGDKNAVAEQQLALKDSLDSVTDSIAAQAKQYKDSGTSLDANTAEGRKNLQWLHQQIDAINQVASSQIKQGNSVGWVTKTLGDNEAALRKAAKAAGLNTDQVDALLKTYAAAPKDVETYMIAHADKAASAALAVEATYRKLEKKRETLIGLQKDHPKDWDRIQGQIDYLTRPRTISVAVAFGSNAAQAARIQAELGDVHPHAMGGNLSPGWNLLGDGGGPELVNRETGRILTANQTKQKLSGGGTTVNIAKQELHVHYPLEGNTAEALPNLRRMFSTALEQR